MTWKFHEIHVSVSLAFHWNSVTPICLLWSMVALIPQKQMRCCETLCGPSPNTVTVLMAVQSDQLTFTQSRHRCPRCSTLSFWKQLYFVRKKKKRKRYIYIFLYIYCKSMDFSLANVTRI